MYEQIPVEVMERYEGKWIVWDQDDQRVLGFGATLDEAADMADQARPDPTHAQRIHHVLPHGTEIVGML
jgi:hypothetical protein